MKAVMYVDGKKVKTFAMECGVVEALVINKALSLMMSNDDVPQADKDVARLIADAMMDAEERSE